ncbi:hypothetical protein SAMN05660690_4313 [Geodermatophilus telluris]|uniref:Phosphotransferase enzyme family protein n=1 Tax=Geodermatophilus telluris TaxID=1190417 RepID=A0A1G6V2F7_9ACTN|nr:hypothetical protein [Geodermatophilus telluris]SDD47789.1 hypothetical protein SAMN05660690_4313 [Geodermatophilus telluris]
MSTHPTIEDYVAAVQDPENAFRTPSLRRAVFALHPVWGIPSPASGNAAVVFKATVDGRDQALRFFIREDASDGRRYGALARHFAEHGLLDCVAGVHWVDDAVEIGGRTWPMVQMEWIEGRTLEVHVGELARSGDVGALHALAGRWREQLRRLQQADFAHGDLQHGNVLVQSSSALRLVDFDGSWITPFAGWPAPAETGQPNYQRTGRTWGRWMDTFPGLVVYTSLLALSRRPDAWRDLHTGENLLLSSDDFARVDATRAWALLRDIEDPEVAHVVGRLRACCAPGWDADGPLEALLDRERVHGRHAQPPPPPPPVWHLPQQGAPAEWWTSPAPAPPGGGHGAAGWSGAAHEEDRPLFGGVSAPPGPPRGQPRPPFVPPPVPPPPPPGRVPPGARSGTPVAAGVAALTALVLFVLVAPTDPGSAVGVALVAGFVAFLVTLAVSRHRGR